MARFRRQAARLVLATLFAFLGRADLRAADDSAEQVLKKNGLEIKGALALADTEGPVKSKLTEARRLAQRLRSLRLQETSTLSAEDRQNAIKTLNDQIRQLRNEISAVARQMNQVPAMRGRAYSTFAQGQFDQLQAYGTSLQLELQQEMLLLNELRSPSANPMTKEKLEAAIKEQELAYRQALLDLRKLVDETTQKYTALGQNAEVKKALETALKGRKDKLKLGPSRDFTANVKLLERLEKAAAQGDSEEPSTKSTRRSRKTSKAKRPVTDTE
jgi:hypothetical protein